MIALVITIIILLILAAISISSLTGENGLLSRALSSKDKSKIAEIIEKVQLDILNAQMENNGELTKDQFKTILENYFDDVPDTLPDDLSELILPTKNKYGNYQIKISDIYDFSLGIVKKANYSDLNIGDYVNYPVYYDNVGTYDNGTTHIPKDEFTGWRILSIDVDNETVKLISAGVPLNYSHPYLSNTSKTVEKLTTKFFSTPIDSSSITDNCFYKCGFKTKSNGNLITNINDLKALFKNKFTEVYGEGEQYTDAETGKTYTYTKDDPKVQSINKLDIDSLLNSTTMPGTIIEEDTNLLTIPCKDFQSESAVTWVSSASNNIYLYYINSVNVLLNATKVNLIGIRPIVTLKSNINFVPANTNINNTKTWNITM